LTICTKFVLTKISLTVLNVSYKFRVIMKFAVILYVCVVQFIVSYQDSSDYSHYNRYLEAWLIKSTGSIWKIRLFPDPVWFVFSYEPQCVYSLSTLVFCGYLDLYLLDLFKIFYANCELCSPYYLKCLIYLY
jgi:hypothetical protein